MKYSDGREQKKRRDAFSGLAKVLGAEELWYWGNYVYATEFPSSSLDNISYWTDNPEQIQGLPEIKKRTSEEEPGTHFVCTTMPPEYSKTVQVN